MYTIITDKHSFQNLSFWEVCKRYTVYAKSGIYKTIEIEGYCTEVNRVRVSNEALFDVQYTEFSTYNLKEALDLYLQYLKKYEAEPHLRKPSLECFWDARIFVKAIRP